MGECLGDALGDLLGLLLGFGAGSSGGGGARDPLLDLDLTLSKLSFEKGSGSDGSAGVGSSDCKGAAGTAISASLNVTRGGGRFLTLTFSFRSSSIKSGG